MKLGTWRRALAVAGVACAAVLLTAPEAKAITITVNSITKLGGNTATGVVGSSNRRSSYDSAVSITNAGTSTADSVGASVTGGTRYASTQTSDANGVFVGSASLTATASYQVVFTVTPGLAGTVYDLEIDTSRIGAFVIRDETSASASASLSAVTGTLNGPVDGGLALAALPGLNTSSTTVQAINQANTTTLTGLTGPQVFTLTFNWTGSTNSSSGANGGDEAVVLMGLDTRINGDVGAADDYPGTSGRTNPAGDGHFVNITATITAVPEPSTFALAGIGLAVGGFAAWRRRR
ncbi:MAG: PEP-CTERM sorting domain-containing protein [Planctomycetaceae bacterium]|nr:PEP-CTERM sorting domain-containing protein [Planctomycetaceae bacterium]